MPETVDILGNPTCPAEAQPSILARAAALFTAPAGLDRMGAVRTSTRQRAFEICEWSASKGRPLRVLWGKVGNPSNVEHYGGYGVDFMTFSNASLSKHDRAIGDGIVEYALANRTRLKVKGIIWRQRRIGYSSGWGSWVNMADCGSATANHYDHVHILFDAADYTPPGTPVVTPPVELPTYYVDPSKVDTFLWSVRDSTGETVHQRPPGFPITTGVELVTRNGKRWVKTKAGYRYALDYLTTTKPDVPKPDVPKPDPEPSVSNTVKICGWNILRRTDTEPGRKRWPTRKPLVGKTLRATGASVFLLVETDSVTAKDCAAELGDHFAYWRFKYYTIIWDTRVWQRPGDAVSEFEFRDNNNRYLLSLPLIHEATGKTVVFDCTHLENDGDTNTDGHKARFVEASHMAEKTKTGTRIGYFDCNSTTSSTAGRTTREKQKPRVVLAKVGFDFLSNHKAKVSNSAYATHHGGKGSSPKGAWIDDMFWRGAASFVSGELVRTDGSDASDHHALTLTIKI